uniref:prepilin peptidase n=1 Tax=Roseovarius salis TaxID=3376063 RepID=UPI0037C843CA
MEQHLLSGPGPVMDVLIVLLGAPCGSFAALLADRLPRGRPVVLSRSRCRACGRALRWWELAPILSFLLLRGRCGRCGAAIPGWLLQAEIAGLALGGLAVWAGLGLAGAAALWCLLALILSDMRHFRLPDHLTAALLVLAFAVAAFPDATMRPDLAAAGRALTGAAVAAGLFLALSLGYRALRGRHGMGAG